HAGPALEHALEVELAQTNRGRDAGETRLLASMRDQKLDRPLDARVVGAARGIAKTCDSSAHCATRSTVHARHPARAQCTWMRFPRGFGRLWRTGAAMSAPSPTSPGTSCGAGASWARIATSRCRRISGSRREEGNGAHAVA